jgi:PAS domain S-box-containing protein
MSELRYRRLFEAAKDGILILDAETGMVLDVNPFLTELLGLSHEVFLGRRVWELGIFKDIAANEAKFAELQAKKYVRYDHLPLETADGRKIAVEFVSNVYLENQQKVIQCNIRDNAEHERVDEALRVSEHHTERILNAIPVRVFWKDKNLVYLGCNAAFARDAGFANPKDIIGKDDFQMVWRDQAESYRNDDRKVIEGSCPNLLIEESQTTPEGKTITLLSSKIPLLDSKGEICGVLGTYTDITERKVEQKRIFQLNRLKAILGGVSSAIIHIPEKEKLLAEICQIGVQEGLFKLVWIGKSSPDGFVQVVAKAGVTEYLDGMRLVTRDEPGGRGPTGTAIRENRAVVAHDAYHDASLAPFRGRLQQFGLRYLAAFPIEVAGNVWGSYQVYAPHTDCFDDNEISLLTQVCAEISMALTAIYHRENRTKAEAHLRLQSSALEAAANAIVITDSKGVIEWANAAFSRLTGYSLADATGKTPSLLKSGKQDEKFYRNLWGTVSAGKVWTGEIINQRKNGALYTEEMTITPIKNEGDEITHFIAVKHDITARKLLEAQFLRAQRMDSVGTLAGGIAHDLNNALAPILMAMEALKNYVTDAAGLRLLCLVEESAQHGADLVSQVLSFGRGVEGATVKINLNHIANEIQNVIYDTFPKNIQFGFAPNRDVWTVTGDPTHLHQVLTNLCVNARDAMPNGGTLKVTIDNTVLDEVYTGMNPDAKAGAYVLVKVEDNGGGIPPGIQDKIFEPFFTTKEIGKGTGLGLSTTMGIVKSHGGFITVYSEIGKGTTFKVYLPANATSKAAEKVAIEKAQLPRGSGETVLLVDDEERVRIIAQNTLERFGYRVLLAANGAEALGVYAQNREQIAVVLTDMAMPVLDGLSTIIALKAMNPDVKIIGSSGLASNGDIGKAVGAGIKDFLPKPYTAETMLTILAKALREQA